MGRDAEALLCFREALDLAVAENGEHHVITAQSLLNLGIACFRLHDFESALVHFRRADAVFTAVGEGDTFSTYTNLINIGNTLFNQGYWEDALLTSSRALTGLRRTLPPEHHYIVGALALIRDANELLGRQADSDAAGAEAVHLSRRSQMNCAGPGCVRQLREDGAPLDVCIKCRRTFYCGKACQTADWKREGGHRTECKVLVAEAVAGAAAGTSS